MRAILIDPWNKTITEVQVNKDDELSSMYALLSNPLGSPVDCFCSGMTWSNGDTLFVDDEGLLKAGMRAFMIDRADGQPLAGNGLIMGGDNMGNSVDARSTIAEISAKVQWTDLITR